MKRTLLILMLCALGGVAVRMSRPGFADTDQVAKEGPSAEANHALAPARWSSPAPVADVLCGAAQGLKRPNAANQNKQIALFGCPSGTIPCPCAGNACIPVSVCVRLCTPRGPEPTPCPDGYCDPYG